MDSMRFWAGICIAATASIVLCAEPVGKRPYEMEWAKRTQDTRAPLVDFENLEGWTVQTTGAEARLSRSQEQPLWGDYVARFAYRGTAPGPKVVVKPPKPIPLPAGGDSVNFWVYGNNWAWVADPTTPQVEIALHLRGKTGQALRLSMGQVNWREWWVMHRRLTAEQKALMEEGGVLEGIEIAGGRNTEDRVLYFDNLAWYQEPLTPLVFEPRPERNLTPLAGQNLGANTGPGRLPFPTTERTILPDNLTTKYEVRQDRAGEEFIWRYRGEDGELIYRYRPTTGTLGDVTAEWVGRGKAFQPLANGGVVPGCERAGAEPAAKPKLIHCTSTGEAVTAAWDISCGTHTARLTYTLRLWQKSLVIDLHCPGGHVGEVGLGKAVGLDRARLVTLPYLTGDYQHRPAMVVAGSAEQPLFLTGLVDHCRSNATALVFANEVRPEGVVYNGGSRYEARTDGKRNDCCERVFLTVSPRFEEVLPNIPNPKSPWMEVTGERLWIAHGASERARDLELWRRLARYGMTKVVITDHETGWRDGGESFTLRTRAAPGKGGDEGQAEYAKQVRALGFRYGIYNNYTDFSPVNEHWSEDYVTRIAGGQWQTAWPRCYNLKPARAVELEARLAPIIQEKFHLDTAYCDVHTAVTPWQYCDRDARVPGASTFAATFYAYGEIMLHQKKTWNGPVYSEGNNHWYYCGLTDGNYGQDQAARLPENPWLVDFDLRKMHPLGCNFGMGNPGMFFGERHGQGQTPQQREAMLDRFLAATLAFGHTGFLVLDGGMGHTVRSYFSVQQVHAAYARETAKSISYADEQGRLLDATAAVAKGAYRRSQVRTEYSNGLVVTVNGHPSETWKTEDGELPSNGWSVKDTREGKLVAWSKQVEGHRADYVDGREYLYADGRGRVTRFDKATSDGPLIAHRRSNGTLELIPVGECRVFGVALEGRTGTAVAMDEKGTALGPAETRLSRGIVYVMPVPQAFSYVVTPAAESGIALRCPRRWVIPGERVTIEGKGQHPYQVPKEAVPGTQIWHQVEGAWVDFVVTGLADAQLELGTELELALKPHVSESVEAVVRLGDQSRTVRLEPETDAQVSFPLVARGEELRELPLTVTAGELSLARSWWLKAEEQTARIADLPQQFHAGQQLRNAAARGLGDATGALAVWSERSCGNVDRACLFMHPPYLGGVGCVFARFGPIPLPSQPSAAFRCLIGKADGSDPGDGILFRVAVVGADGKETVVAQRQWIEHAWTPLEADLSAWAGQKIELKLMADVGAADDSSGDWACWADLRIESAVPVLTTTLHEVRVPLERVSGPYRVDRLSPTELRKAKSGVLHFQAIGLEQTPPYVSQATLNGVTVGPLPATAGEEAKGVWANGEVRLPAKALAALGDWNRLAIDNPGRDNFKIRSVWIELELADGRRCSSEITAKVYTQPADWKYAEGTGVAFGQPIELAIRFR